MPAEGIDFSDRKDLLSYEEIIRLAKIFRKLGVNKVRLTGGEPFVRKDIGQLIESLAAIFPKVHITTNATILEKHIPLLQSINIAGLNISLDSLDANRFFMITRRDSFEEVMSNIRLCLAQNIPIKINMVVMKGVNDMEILDFVQFGIENGIEVRFIEAMPFNEDDGNKAVFLSAADILKFIQSKYPATVLFPEKEASSSNKYLVNGSQKIGIIPAYSRSLCGTCNRIRLTPKGELLNCLYAQTGTQMLPLLRNGNLSDADIEELIVDSVYHKKKNGFEEEALIEGEVFRSMTTIGG